MDAKFAEGQRVTLRSDEGEGWVEEAAVVIGVEDQDKYPGMYVVRVGPMVPGDDGIREVEESQIRP
jgi:hypothetical protein